MRIFLKSFNIISAVMQLKMFELGRSMVQSMSAVYTGPIMLKY